MGDLRLPQFSDLYDRNKMGAMVDTLENTFANISKVFAFTRKGAYQLSASTTQVGNIGGGADDLISYSLAANTLAKDGYNIEIKAWGTYAANANNKTVILYFGGTAIYTTGVIAANDGVWVIDATVTRTGAATQQSIATMISSNTSVVDSATYTVPTETLSATIVIKCTGTATADNDIIQKGLLIKLVPQE